LGLLGPPFGVWAGPFHGKTQVHLVTLYYQKMKNCLLPVGESKGRDEGRKEGVCILCLGHL
jgi:hypothetical protein